MLGCLDCTILLQATQNENARFDAEKNIDFLWEIDKNTIAGTSLKTAIVKVPADLFCRNTAREFSDDRKALDGAQVTAGAIMKNNTCVLPAARICAP